MEHQNPPINTAKNQGSSWSQSDFIFLAVVGVLIFLLRMYIANPFIVSGESMDPTFHNGQYIIVDQISYNFNDPQRGDIVIFKPAGDTSKFFIKRVIGLPGEEVRVSENSVFIKKVGSDTFEKLNEYYIEEDFNSDAEWKLTDSQLFVLGDNRDNSLDSRYFGPIEKDSVTGRAWIRLFPFNTIDFLPGKLDL